MLNFVGKDQEDGDNINQFFVLPVNILNIYIKLSNLFFIRKSRVPGFRVRGRH